MNKDLGKLEPRLADAIAAAAADVVQDEYDDEFPLVVYQTGSSTQSNMNMNEVSRTSPSSASAVSAAARSPFTRTTT